MSTEVVQISRYPNRRLYARGESRYVSLADVEELIKSGRQIEVRDSQSGEDITRAVLTQIIVERQPEKMLLFPTDMLHLIVRSNDVMKDFLRDYFRQSLTYLEFLQQHGAAAPLAPPIHWMKAWLDGLSSQEQDGTEDPQQAADAETLSERLHELERRLRQLERASQSD